VDIGRSPAPRFSCTDAFTSFTRQRPSIFVCALISELRL
jgi:hypothetical protein